MTYREMWCKIIRAKHTDWVYRDEGVYVLSTDLDIWLELDLGGEPFAAPWAVPLDDPGMFAFAYRLHYRSTLVERIPMACVDEGTVEIPVPSQVGDEFVLSYGKFCLALVPNRGRDLLLLDYLERAGIRIVRHEPGEAATMPVA